MWEVRMGQLSRNQCIALFHSARRTLLFWTLQDGSRWGKMEWLTLTPSYFCARLWCLCKSIFICIFLVCTQKRSYIHLPSSSFFALPQSLVSFQSTVTTVQLDIWTILSCFTKVISHLSINLAVQGGTLSLQQICTIADVICSRFKLASTFSL